MIPFLVKQKLQEKYGKDFSLPAHIDLLKTGKEACQTSEHSLQQSFFAWLASYLLDDPFIHLAHAIPNGGTRNIVEASKLKAEGVKSGIPDSFLPIPKKGYHGLYIEFKVKYNKPDEDQRAMLLMLDELGYKCICVNCLETAKAETLFYLYGR